MKKLAVSLAAALCALGATTAANADAVTFSGYAHGSQNVTFTVPNAANTGNATGTAGAGGFLTSLNGGPSFTSYCVDLYQNISFNTPYSDYSIAAPGAHVFANSNAYTDLGRLYATAGMIGDALQEAAFQLSVWEIAYETSGAYNVGSGVASFVTSTGVRDLASTWLSQLGNHGNGPTIGVLESRGQQDMIYAPIPEPSEIMLMVTGLIAMGAFAKRRRKAKTSAA